MDEDQTSEDASQNVPDEPLPGPLEEQRAAMEQENNDAMDAEASAAPTDDAQQQDDTAMQQLVPEDNQAQDNSAMQELAPQDSQPADQYAPPQDTTDSSTPADTTDTSQEETRETDTSTDNTDDTAGLQAEHNDAMEELTADDSAQSFGEKLTAFQDAGGTDGAFPDSSSFDDGGESPLNDFGSSVVEHAKQQDTMLTEYARRLDDMTRALEMERL